MVLGGQDGLWREGRHARIGQERGRMDRGRAIAMRADVPYGRADAPRVAHAQAVT